MQGRLLVSLGVQASEVGLYLKVHGASVARDRSKAAILIITYSPN